MKKLLIGLAVILSLPVIYVFSPRILPVAIIARVYYPPYMKAEYLKRHANESFLAELRH